MDCCIPSALSAFKAHSSAKRNSLSLSTWTFVLACSLLRLNSLPSVLYRMAVPGLASRKASVSIAENIKLSSVEARRQPCLIPFVTGKGVEDSLSSRTCACIQSGNYRTTWMNLSEHAHDLPETVAIDGVECFGEIDKCCVKSTFCSWHFSCSWRAVNIMSVVPRSFLNSHWLFGSRPCSR